MNEFMVYSAVLATGFTRIYYRRQRRGEAEKQALHMQKTRLEAELSQAHLNALRMQLNPHFLFNTLNSMSTLVDQDPKGARRMIVRLSDLLRYVLEENERQEVPLYEELQFLLDYLDIQKVRFPDRLSVETNIAPEVKDAMVPTFILQPIVENAIKHGAEWHSGPTRIVIRGQRDESMLMLSVSDNGGGPDGEIENITFGTGLQNVKDRLAELYDDSHALDFGRTKEGEFQVIIRLPFHVEDELFAGPDNAAALPHVAQAELAERHDE